ncbi:MAG: TonB family protein [Candidatus Omnitrophota bacterium]|nr:TonB family protein [Candidatus Omnitrophota bacterium]
MKKNFLYAGLVIACVVMPVFAGDEQTQNIDMITGDLETIEVKNLTRLSVTDPSVADVSDAKPDKVLILAKKSGQTAIFVWDDDGKRAITVRVAGEDLKALKERISNVMAKAGIKGVTVEENLMEGKIVLSGAVTKADKAVLEKFTDPYAANVINLTMEETSDDLVQVDMQITELNTTLNKNIGFEWTNADASDSSRAVALKYNESLPTTNGSVKDFFKIGDFNRTSAIMSVVNALVEEGKGRVLSNPRLVVVSGKEASFLVGGEIPIRTTTTSASGGSTQENIQFKQYGVNLTITPAVRDGKVDVLLKVEIRDIDKANKVGNDVAFLTREAQTQLYLDNGQTIVLAGLIKHNDGDSVKRVPFFSSIPIVGMLFRNRSTPTVNTDTELVITLTPTILKDKKYAAQETVYPSKALHNFQSETNARFDKRPLNFGATPPAKAPVVVVPVTGMAAYVRLVQMKISQSIAYPYEALQKNWQGTVKLRLRIAKDGSLSEAVVVEPSGHDVFDQDALNTAKIAAPFAAFPPDMAGNDLVVTIPIVYSHGGAPSSS